MGRNNLLQLFLALLSGGILFNSCVEPFNPGISAGDVGILIVEGYINADSGVTTIQLSRATPLSQGNVISYEEGAEVWIESDANEIFALAETDRGFYTSDTLTLPTDRSYRIGITRANGRTYQSELLPVKVTPPIDSIHWEWRDRLYIYVNAHDENAATQYYTWKFREEWQIRSQYVATLYYESSSDSLILMFPSNALKLYDCWGKSSSNEIILASTRQLTEDRISYPVASVPAAAEKIQTRYAVSVYQRTMTQDEYDYTILVKKNAEQTGSFFDPMPSQLFGNIHAVANPEETVVGYIGAYTTETRRLFIDASELPPSEVQEKCTPIDFEYTKDNLRMYLSNPAALLPYEVYYENEDPLKPRVIALPAICLDCRLKPGATNIHPDWDTES